MVRRVSFALSVSVLCAGIFLRADLPEFLALFDATIKIESDGTLDVTEDMDYGFNALVQRRGMLRDIPTVYAGPAGTNYSVALSDISVLRDGHQEPFHIESVQNGKRVRIGRAELFLSPGIYHYKIHYRTNRQLLFFSQKYDELFWNVTGNLWRIPILKARVTVELPPEILASKVSLWGYTGRYGESGRGAKFWIEGDRIIHGEVIQPLGPREGFSVSLTWPKGLIMPPTTGQEFLWFVRDNLGLILFFFSFLALLIFYGIVWRRVKKSQNVGPIIPLFYPPKDISPSGCRYILHMGYDSRQLAAELVDMAVHGFLKIEQDTAWFGKGTYRLVRAGFNSGLNPESQLEGADGGEIKTPNSLQAGILERLFRQSEVVKLSQEGRATVQDAAQFIRGQHGKAFKDFFLLNAKYSIWAGCFSLFITIVAWILDGWINPIIPLFLFGLVGLGALLIRAYTPQGCRIRDEIKGFTLFLKTTETERLDMVGTPPTRTPELYEKYLPYAIALNAERQWTQQFASVFKQLEAEDHAYSPLWYGGGRLFTLAMLDSFATDLGSFASDLNIPLTTYKTSSGGGGGGFSGGGRGGGGGGGW